MTFSIPPAYQRMVGSLVKPANDILASLTPERVNLIHMAVGVCGEVAELIEGVRRGDVTNIAEETGDVIFYLVGIMQMEGYRTRVWTGVAPSQSPDIEFELVIAAGALLDAAKKPFAYGRGIDWEAVSTEVNRISMLLVLRSTLNRTTVEAAMRANQIKLFTGEKARYKDGYSDSAAEIRADKE